MKNVRVAVQEELERSEKNAGEVAVKMDGILADVKDGATVDMIKKVFVFGYMKGAERLAKVAIDAKLAELKSEIEGHDGWKALRLGAIVVASAFIFGFLLRGCIPVPARAW